MKTLLKDKEAIHCPTKELAEKVLKVLHEDGYEYIDGESLSKTYWEEYREEMCYTNNVYFSPRSFYLDEEGYTIIPAEEFLERVVLPEKWCIKITKENLQQIGNYYNRQGNSTYTSTTFIGSYYTSHNRNSKVSVTSNEEFGANFVISTPTEEYPEITFEQFKKHILKPMKYKLKVEYPGSPKVGTITEEDMSKYPDFWEIVKETFKEGDWVTCLPGFSNSGLEGDSKYGGAGYQSNLVFKVKKVVNHSKYDVLWIADRGTGVYNHVVRKATQEEIDAATKIEVAGYTLERVGSEYKFGCQTFDKAEVKTIKRLLESPINAEITISGTKITLDLINKL